jgi:chromatin segregation and condensation protein Rec8/ScpA/Scc1 (kleisin family)
MNASGKRRRRQQRRRRALLRRAGPRPVLGRRRIASLIRNERGSKRLDNLNLKSARKLKKMRVVELYEHLEKVTERKKNRLLTHGKNKLVLDIFIYSFVNLISHSFHEQTLFHPICFALFSDICFS